MRVMADGAVSMDYSSPSADGLEYIPPRGPSLVPHGMLGYGKDQRMVLSKS